MHRFCNWCLTLFPFAVGFPILLFFLLGDPYKRGFFCDDESLMHPFKDSTVRNWMLYIIGLVIPVGVVSGVEREWLKIGENNQVELGWIDWNWIGLKCFYIALRVLLGEMSCCHSSQGATQLNVSSICQLPVASSRCHTQSALHNHFKFIIVDNRKLLNGLQFLADASHEQHLHGGTSLSRWG